MFAWDLILQIFYYILYQSSNPGMTFISRIYLISFFLKFFRNRKNVKMQSRERILLELILLSINLSFAYIAYFEK